jgi:hypothetical protein
MLLYIYDNNTYRKQKEKYPHPLLLAFHLLKNTFNLPQRVAGGSQILEIPGGFTQIASFIPYPLIRALNNNDKILENLF